MPKLNPQQVSAAQAQGYESKGSGVERKPLPIADGQPYVYKLVACTSGPSKANPNKIQWTWELTLDNRYHPEFCNGEYLERLWYYTPVEGGQEWAIAKMLHAFGYSADTDTDELINDEAPVLVFLSVDTYTPANSTTPKTKMVARRFAQHYEADYPQAQGSEPPFGGDSDPYAQTAQAPASAAVSTVKAGPETPAADDPWATGVPAQPTPAPQPPVYDESDTF